jgi:hypothetical protein
MRTAGSVKVLLDENLPHRLRNRHGRHEVSTVRYMGWADLKNGELLKVAEEAGLGSSSPATRHLHMSKTYRVGE